MTTTQTAKIPRADMSQFSGTLAGFFQRRIGGARLLHVGVLVMVFGLATLAWGGEDPILSIPDTVTTPIGVFTVPVQLDNAGADGVTAWDIIVCFDPTILTVLQIDLGSDAVAEPPDFEASQIFADRWMAAVVVSLGGGNVLDPGLDLELQVATYAVVGSADSTPLTFCATLEASPVETQVCTGAPCFLDGHVDGMVTFETPINPDLTLRLGTVDADVPGSTLTIPVCLDNLTGDDIFAWSFNVCHDASALDLQSVMQGADSGALNGGMGPDFVNVDIQNSIFDPSGCGVAVVTSFGPTLVPLSGGADLELHSLDYVQVQIPASGTPVEFCAEIDPNAVPLVVTSSGMEIVESTPVQVPGGVNPPPEVQFIRGDANGDGTFSALTEAIYILNFQFVAGPAPPCLEAVDANGNGSFDALSDTLYVLNCQFTGGPCPTAPHPGCGVDPDGANSLGCDSGGC